LTTVDTSKKQLNIQIVECGALSWIDIQQPGVAEMQYLKDRYHFHQLSLDDCLSVIQLPKLDEFLDHLFMVTHFPRFNKETRLTTPSEVDLFAGANYVVTVHNGDLRPLLKLFHDCQVSDSIRQEVMSRGSGYLLYRILDALVDYCFPVLSKIVENVHQIEQRVFDEWGQKVVREMALLRRDILSYLRLVRPEIEVLEEMEKKDFPFLKVQEEIYFGDLADHIRRIHNELETLKEVMDGLYDAHASMAVYRTNDITRILTVAATVVLPFLVVSGLYGMNVPLPGAGAGLAFWLLILGTLGISAVMLVVFRLGRWL